MKNQYLLLIAQKEIDRWRRRVFRKLLIQRRVGTRVKLLKSLDRTMDLCGVAHKK